MNWITDKLNYAINTVKYFKIYIIVQMFTLITLYDVIPYIGTIGNIITALWGGYIAVGLLYNKKAFDFKYSKIIGLFFVAVVISVLSNYKLHFFDNIETCIILYIVLFILFPPFIESKVGLDKEVFWFSNITSLFFGLVAWIGFFMYATGTVWYNYFERFSGLFSNPNTSGLVMAAGVGLSLVAITSVRTMKRKLLYMILHIINIIINFVMLVLSGSNTAYMMIAAGAIIYIIAVNYIKGHTRKKYFKSILICLFCIVISLVVLSSLISFTINTVTYVPSIVENIQTASLNDKKNIKEENVTKSENNIDKDDSNSSLSKEPETSKIEKTDIERDLELESLDNGRFSRWKIAIQASKQNILFGCGPRNSYEALCEYAKHKDIPVYSGDVHNMFIELLLTTGIVGFSLFFILFIMIIVNLFKLINRVNFETNKFDNLPTFLAVLSLTAMLFIANLTESAILFRSTPFAMIFWIIGGYLVNMIMICEEKEYDEN